MRLSGLVVAAFLLVSANLFAQHTSGASGSSASSATASSAALNFVAFDLVILEFSCLSNTLCYWVALLQTGFSLLPWNVSCFWPEPSASMV